MLGPHTPLLPDYSLGVTAPRLTFMLAGAGEAPGVEGDPWAPVGTSPGRGRGTNSIPVAAGTAVRDVTALAAPAAAVMATVAAVLLLQEL